MDIARDCQCITSHRNGKRIIGLNIADDFDVMQPALIELLQARVPPHLR